MSDILLELRDFEKHSLRTGQEQVAELAHNAATEIEDLRETLKELRNSPEVSRELWLAVEGEKALTGHGKEGM